MLIVDAVLEEFERTCHHLLHCFPDVRIHKNNLQVGTSLTSQPEYSIYNLVRLATIL